MDAAGTALTAAVTGGVLPRSAVVRAGELDLHCLVWGEPCEKTALLVHGNGGHGHWWDPLVAHLLPGWQLIAPDLRGHGESGWPEVPRYRIEDFATDLVAVLDRLAPRRVALIGHSMGGRVVTWLAAHHADRAGVLAVLDSRLTDIGPGMARHWRGRVAGRRAGRGYTTREEALAAFRFVPDEPDVPREVVADLAHHAVVERGPEDWTFRFDRGVLALDGDGAGDMAAILAHIRCPTAVMNGERSAVRSAAEQRTQERLQPGWERHVFPGAHHFLLSHAPAVGPVLREFLERTFRG
jgi:pimeloyl-ACP methyl ester carboxylesterase